MGESSVTMQGHQNQFLGGYAEGGRKHRCLEDAIEACFNHRGRCGGITRERHGEYTLREGSDLGHSPDGEMSWRREDLVRGHRDSFLSGYAEGGRAYRTLEEAIHACMRHGRCGGITRERKGYTLREGTDLGRSPDREMSWLKWDLEGRGGGGGYGGGYDQGYDDGWMDRDVRRVEHEQRRHHHGGRHGGW